MEKFDRHGRIRSVCVVWDQTISEMRREEKLQFFSKKQRVWIEHSNSGAFQGDDGGECVMPGEDGLIRVNFQSTEMLLN